MVESHSFFLGKKTTLSVCFSVPVSFKSSSEFLGSVDCAETQGSNLAPYSTIKRITDYDQVLLRCHFFITILGVSRPLLRERKHPVHSLLQYNWELLKISHSARPRPLLVLQIFLALPLELTLHLGNAVAHRFPF